LGIIEEVMGQIIQMSRSRLTRRRPPRPTCPNGALDHTVHLAEIKRACQFTQPLSKFTSGWAQR